jgi:hypothetical protein
MNIKNIGECREDIGVVEKANLRRVVALSILLL